MVWTVHFWYQSTWCRALNVWAPKWIILFLMVWANGYTQCKNQKRRQTSAQSKRALAMDIQFMKWTATTLLHRGPVAQWITRLPTEQKIAGSIPARIGIHFLAFLVCSCILLFSFEQFFFTFLRLWAKSSRKQEVLWEQNCQELRISCLTRLTRCYMSEPSPIAIYFI